MICVPTVSCILAPLFYCASALHWVALRVSLSRSSSYTKLSNAKRLKSAGWESPSNFQKTDYTRHTLLVPAAERRGFRGEDGAQWYGASQTPESGLCEFAFQSAESTSPYFSPHFFFFFPVVAIPFLTPTRSEGRSRWTAAHSPGSDTLLQAIRRLYAYA